MFARNLLYGAGLRLAVVLSLIAPPVLEAGARVARDQSGVDPTSLPAWAVLVLQPVGDKRVRPVTGVVVSAGGAVIVPADFAAAGDVLIVLDGGSDIIEHGRPATVRSRDAAAGIAVLDVRGLERPPAALAVETGTVDEILHFAAFPPAEKIAEGGAPLWLAARRGDLSGGSPDNGSPAGPLPNLSGPLLDRCGALAGYSLADGVPGMEAAAGTAYIWSEALLSVLRSAGIEPVVKACAATEETVVERDGANPEAAAESPSAGTEPASAVEADLARPAGDATGSAMARLVWITGVLLVLVAALLGWRFRHREAPAPGLLQDHEVRRARSGRPDNAAANGNAGSDVAAHWSFELQGEFPGGAEFTRRCPVNPAAVDVVVGSGPVDIQLEAAGIGREHVRFGGSAGAVTVCDLGAPGGTWINRVPCMRGEVMFLGDGATVVLGETGFRVSIVPPAGHGRETDRGERSDA